MTTTVNLVAADGATSTLSIADPVINTPVPTTKTLSLSDLNLVFAKHTWFSPPVAVVPEFQQVSTPHGPGFQFISNDTADPTIWDARMKTVSAKTKHFAVDGVTEHWEFYLYLPSQQVVTSWNGGVMWEFHSGGTSSGHTITLDNTGRGPTSPSFRFVTESTAGGGSFHYAPLTFDTWHHFVIDVKWLSEKSTIPGFYRLTLDGTQYVNYSGPTWYTTDTSQTAAGSNAMPNLGFGFYADIGANQTPPVPSVGSNQVTLAGITVTTS